MTSLCRTGQEIRIKGENIYEVESLYLTDFNPLEVDDDGNPVEPEGPVTKYEITDYEIGPDFDLITAKLPATVLEKGYIVIECHSGSSVIGFTSAKPNPPVIEEISSDMPVWGEPCTLFGKEFNDLVAIIIGKTKSLFRPKTSQSMMTKLSSHSRCPLCLKKADA